MVKDSTIGKGFLISGLSNLSVLIFSRFFTNDVIPESDPMVMSNFGILMIVLWGLAYMSIAKSFRAVRWLVAVFAVEKLVYGIVWINWLMHHSLEAVYAKDLMAGMFFSVYGLIDWTFFLFFSWVFWYSGRTKG